MNLKLFSEQLSKIFNTLGNDWLVENFITEPFDMNVVVRKGGTDDLRDYEVEIYTDRTLPHTFEYREGIKPHYYGAHISKIQSYFKELLDYIDPTFGVFRKTIGVKFMDVDNF